MDRHPGRGWGQFEGLECRLVREEVASVRCWAEDSGT